MFKTARKRPYRVAIEGFSEFERGALASFFRLAERRVPAYVQVTTPDSSDFLIADADQPRVLDWIARERRIGDTVFVGAQAPADALSWLTRPIEPVHIMRALDALLGGRPEAASVADDDDDGAEPTAPAVLQVLDAAAGVTPIAEPLEAKRRPNRAGASRGVQKGSGRTVLVVDDSAVARSFLAQRLRNLDYRVVLAANGEEALETAAHTAYAIVFLDIDLGSANRLDGLQVCQRLKQRAQHPGGVVPAVVITTGSTSATDRVRGSLAGCDAYLTKPLMDADFAAALAQVDPLFRWAEAE
jgi:two-component system cell cycle response regulator